MKRIEDSKVCLDIASLAKKMVNRDIQFAAY
jgi:hypothetical protein